MMIAGRSEMPAKVKWERRVLIEHENLLSFIDTLSVAFLDYISPVGSITPWILLSICCCVILSSSDWGKQKLRPKDMKIGLSI